MDRQPVISSHSASRLTLAGGFAFLAVLFLISRNFPFFWDNVLISKVADFFYRSDFHSWVLPDSLDQLPPSFGAYLALWWKTFGRSLPLSHLAVLPFALGAFWQFYRLAVKLLPEKLIPLALILFLADPTLLAQASMVSPELPILFFFLWTLNLILSGKRGLMAVALLLLGMTYLRGTIALGAIMLTDLSLGWLEGERKRLAFRTLYYIPAGLVAAAFFAWHYSVKGYWVMNPASGWAESQQWLGPLGMLRNAGIILWRWLDFGRVFLWLGAAGFLWMYFRKRIRLHTEVLKLLAIILPLPLLFSLLFLPFSNAIAHRYFLPFYGLFSLLLVYHLGLLNSLKWKKIWAAIWIAGLLSGNLWVYPDHIAQGWDASLAHLPYHRLRKEMVAYMKTHDIPPAQTGTVFPNLSSNDVLYLNGDPFRMKAANPDSNRFVFYANVFNDFPDSDLRRFREEWTVRKRLKKRGVEVILFEKPD